MTTTSFQVAFVALQLLYPDLSITPRIPMAQAVIESGSWTSHVWDVNNNCFGMTPPAGRETTCTNKGQKGGFANYTNPLDCLRDYFLWARAMGVKNDGDLDAFIKAGRYAEDKKYYPKITATVAALAKGGKYIEPAKILGTGLLGGAALTVAGVMAISHIIEEVA
jgi:flagellum-specific peptidoglycan hydrolase FlgJ